MFLLALDPLILSVIAKSVVGQQIRYLVVML